MKTTIPQILEEVQRQTKKDQQIKVLKTYDSPVLRGILKLNFDSNYKMDLPESEPPFRKDIRTPEGYSDTNLYVEFRRFYIWTEQKLNLSRARKEVLFIQMLEGLHWKEAELLCLAKDKKLQTKFDKVTESIVREAFYDLLPKEPIPPKKFRDIVVSKNEVKNNSSASNT